MTLISTVRITSRQSAVWRKCPQCFTFAPMSANQTHCRACSKPRHPSPRRH